MIEMNVAHRTRRCLIYLYLWHFKESLTAICTSEEREEKVELQAAVPVLDCGLSMPMIDSGAARRERRDRAFGSVR